MKTSAPPLHSTIRYLCITPDTSTVMIRDSTPATPAKADTALAQLTMARDVTEDLGGPPQMITETSVVPVRFLWSPRAAAAANPVASRMLSTLCAMTLVVRGPMVVHALPDEHGVVPTLSDAHLQALARAAGVDVLHPQTRTRPWTTGSDNPLAGLHHDRPQHARLHGQPVAVLAWPLPSPRPLATRSNQ